MVLSEVITEVRSMGVPVNENRIRYAIKSEQISRPRLDGSLRFDFSEENVDEIVSYFQSKRAATVSEVGVCG